MAVGKSCANAASSGTTGVGDHTGDGVIEGVVVDAGVAVAVEVGDGTTVGISVGRGVRVGVRDGVAVMARVGIPNGASASCALSVTIGEAHALTRKTINRST